MIPKIIHQSWKDSNIPCKWKRYQDSWKALHPSYHYMLHTDEDNLRLVTEFYPEFLELYNAYKYPVQRADLVRYMYMHHYGGVYADLDLECLRPIDHLMHKEILVLESNENFSGFPESFMIANFFLACEEQSTFMLRLLQSILKDDLSYSKYKIPDVLISTGPMKLTRVYNEETVKPDLLPSIVFSPITRNELKKRRNFGEAAYVMSELPADTLGIHHFYGSWI